MSPPAPPQGAVSLLVPGEDQQQRGRTVEPKRGVPVPANDEQERVDATTDGVGPPVVVPPRRPVSCSARAEGCSASPPKNLRQQLRPPCGLSLRKQYDLPLLETLTRTGSALLDSVRAGWRSVQPPASQPPPYSTAGGAAGGPSMSARSASARVRVGVVFPPPSPARARHVGCCPPFPKSVSRTGCSPRPQQQRSPAGMRM